MKKGTTVILQVVVVLIGIGIFALMLWEPHLEGRNAHATLFEIYFNDPFLAYAYFGSIPFFTALAQTIKVLGYAGQNSPLPPEALYALRSIRYCAIALIGFVIVAEILIMLIESDDRAGGVFMGLLAALGATAMAATAARFERNLRTTLKI